MGNISYINFALSAAVGAFIILNLGQKTGAAGFFLGGFQGILTIGSLASFLQYTRQFSNPITQVSQQMNNVLMALAGAERIFEIIDQKPELDEGYVMLVNAKLDNNGEINLGNIFEQDLEEIINSERAQRLYNGFTNRNACEELCKRCSFVRKF